MGIAKIHASVTDLKKKLGIGCRTVGRAVTSDIRGPRLKPLLSAIITYNLYLHTVNHLHEDLFHLINIVFLLTFVL